MTAVADACAELGHWLPYAEALIAQPDADAARSHTAPHSRPPWNAQAANALLDALEGIRRLEQDWRSDIASRHVTIRHHARTGATLASIQRLAAAVTTDQQHTAVIQLTRWTTTILQLPAIGREETRRKIAAECPYCGFPMLWAYVESGRVACIRYGCCEDSRGCHPTGIMDVGPVSGEPMIAWADGLIQVPPREVDQNAR